MNRMMAIVEREMRKFFRSPALMLASMIFPLVQLIILGNAFGGKIRDAKVAIVDQDGGPQALRVRKHSIPCAPIFEPLCPFRMTTKSRRGRRAQREIAGRGDYSAAVFAARVGAEPSAHRAGGRQQRQFHEFGG